MGIFQVFVTITNPKNPKQSFKEKFWVDTGALYSFVPENRLISIVIDPIKTRNLILNHGRRDRRLLGEALFTIEELDETMTCPVFFAPKDSLYLLGATALENFGVNVDPATKQLKLIFGIIGSRPTDEM